MRVRRCAGRSALPPRGDLYLVSPGSTNMNS
jgi:hypothetical protein